MRSILLAALLLTTLTTPATADPATGRGREPGNGPERNQVAATDAPLTAATARGDNWPDANPGYPRRTQLRAYP
ncbi:hypothetical protein, partial [Saccharothrix longispora]|uniref:hypothetical protein n=1 Tax=Saccharothrix longispora TaxID=33920 RepID=UPI0028FD4266